MRRIAARLVVAAACLTAIPGIQAQYHTAGERLVSGRWHPAPTAGRPEMPPKADVELGPELVSRVPAGGGCGVDPRLRYYADRAVFAAPDNSMTVELCEAGANSLVKIDGVYRCPATSRIYLSDRWTVALAASNPQDLSGMHPVGKSEPKAPPPEGKYQIVWTVPVSPPKTVWSQPFTVAGACSVSCRCVSDR